MRTKIILVVTKTKIKRYVKMEKGDKSDKEMNKQECERKGI